MAGTSNKRSNIQLTAKINPEKHPASNTEINPERHNIPNIPFRRTKIDILSFSLFLSFFLPYFSFVFVFLGGGILLENQTRQPRLPQW